MDPKEAKILGVLRSWLGDGVSIHKHMDAGGATVTARHEKKIVATAIGATVNEAINRLGHSIAREWVKVVRSTEPKRFGSP
jgi:hypothetical protein